MQSRGGTMEVAHYSALQKGLANGTALEVQFTPHVLRHAHVKL